MKNVPENRTTEPVETKNQTFQRLAEPRVTRVLETLRILGNLSNASRYEYSEVEIAIMFDAMEGALRECRAMFKLVEKKQTRFSFGSPAAPKVELRDYQIHEISTAVEEAPEPPAPIPVDTAPLGSSAKKDSQKGVLFIDAPSKPSNVDIDVADDEMPF